MLRQRIQDKHSLTIPFSERHAAHTEKLECENRLKRLTDHRSAGGFELGDDDPRVVDERTKLDKLTAEAKRLDDLDTVRSAQWRETGYALVNIESWFRDCVPRETVCWKSARRRHHHCPRGSRSPRRFKPASGASVSYKPTRGGWKLHHFHPPMRGCGCGKRSLRSSERGKPNVSRLVEHDGDIDFVEASHLVPVIGKTEANIAGWQEPDAFLLTCFLNRDALIAALDDEITAESDDANAMTHEQRQKATATIMSDMLACDRELSELIWKAQAANLPVRVSTGRESIGGFGLAACHRAAGQARRDNAWA